MRDLLRAARQAGLRPKSDVELLPLLLRLLGAHIPVAQWPTRMSKAQRAEHAREALQGQAAAADWPVSFTPAGPEPVTVSGDSTVVAMRRQGRAQETVDAVDADRRRREQVAVGRTISLPPRLGEAMRRSGPFLLVEDDAAGSSEEVGIGEQDNPR